MKQTLLLFDIDGTLVQRASAAHAEALRDALKLVHGVDIGMPAGGPPGPSGRRRPGRVDAAGRTDGEIARLLLLDAGVSAERIDERADDVRDACCRRYAELCPADLSDKVAPGIPALLEWLEDRGEARLSLLTGNFEPVARLKLRRAGLGHWFEAGQGAFGSDSEDRTMLPSIARRRAGRASGLDCAWPRERTLMIGDTPRDIACARADGLRCLAVTTGPHAEDQLTGADAIARSSGELRELLSAVL